MLVKRSIAVKILVTQEFKEGVLLRLDEALRKIEQTLLDLERQGASYLGELGSKDPRMADVFRKKLSSQISRQKDLQARLLSELSEVKSLQPGDEYHQGNIDGFAEVRVGDDLETKLRSAELIVKDGIVVRIEGE